jgi:Berberine and berberine like
MVAPPMPMIPAEAHGQLVMMALMVYAGPAERAEGILAPFRGLATPLADLLQPMPYHAMFQAEEEGFHPTAVSHTMFVDRVDLQVAETIMEHLRASDAPIRVTQLRVLGGAVARVPADATAYPHRQRPVMVNLAAFYEGPEERVVRQAWVDRFAAALDQGDSSAYVNFLGDEGAARVRDAYPGPTWDRLVAVKRRYDPTNLFHRNQNVPPDA